MSQAYSDPKRASDPYSLPDVEVWRYPTRGGSIHWTECPRATDSNNEHAAEHGPDCHGWYWQACFPGCLPDSEPNGPFATGAEALADAQEGNEAQS